MGIARALAARPQLLLADEPTGQLDSGTAATVMDLIGELVHARGVAAVVTTHDAALVRRADRVLELHDGRVKARLPHPHRQARDAALELLELADVDRDDPVAEARRASRRSAAPTTT